MAYLTLSHVAYFSNENDDLDNASKSHIIPFETVQSQSVTWVLTGVENGTQDRSTKCD
jgi:hypothetical protein